MSFDRTGAGDPARTLALLWPNEGASPTRGPRRGLDVASVVAAATNLADKEGLEAVTMRRLATDLGVGPMTIYTYVPARAELVDLMMDAAFTRMPLTGTAGQPWTHRLRVVAEENRRLYLAHPWAATVCTTRPPLGPGQMAKYNHELQALEGLGLSDVEMDDVLSHVLAFVQANARASADSRAAQLDSAMSDQDWWEANEPLLGRILNVHAYPTAVRVGTAAGTEHGSAYDPEHAYRFGLDLVLRGLSSLIDSASAPRSVGRSNGGLRQ